MLVNGLFQCNFYKLTNVAELTNNNSTFRVNPSLMASYTSVVKIRQTNQWWHLLVIFAMEKAFNLEEVRWSAVLWLKVLYNTVIHEVLMISPALTQPVKKLFCFGLFNLALDCSESNNKSENTHHVGKYHCTAELLLD